MLEKGDGGIFSSQAWVGGEPEKSFLTGVRIKGKIVYDVVTYRCIVCGYLDSYALSKQ